MTLDTRAPTHPDDDRTPDTTDDADPPGRLRPVLWRLHFISGFLVAPVALWLAVTGILYAWNPQIESAMYGDRREVTGQGELAPLSDQVDAALAAHPDHRVLSVQPSGEAGDATEVAMAPADAQSSDPFTPPPGAFTAYVDPVSTDVVGGLHDTSKPDEWLRNMHSNFKLGTTVGTLTELAASWVIVSLATGLYLWWPKSRRALRRAFVPRFQGLRSGARKPWRDLHSVIGFVILVPIVAMVATGLTWTEYAGRWVDVVKDTAKTESPSLDTALPGAAAAGAGGEGGSGEHAEHLLDATSPATFADIDAVVAGAEGAGLRHPFTITAPMAEGSAWTAAEADSSWPVETTRVAVDPATGEVTDRVEFADNAALDQATSLGIYFHQGELFGLFNQLLLTFLAGALIALLVTGYVAWWKRRPAQALAVPPRYGKLFRKVPIPLVLGFAATMVLLPTLGVTFVVYLVVERLYRAVRPASPTPTPAA